MYSGSFPYSVLYAGPMKALAGAFRSVADCAYTKNGRPAPKYILGGYKNRAAVRLQAA